MQSIARTISCRSSAASISNLAGCQGGVLHWRSKHSYNREVKTLKKFKPSRRSNENPGVPVFRTESEKLTYEAEKLVKRAQKEIANKSFERKRREFLEDEDEDGDEAKVTFEQPRRTVDSKRDFLPPEFKITDFPKFEKIMGWDKTNPTLRDLKRELSLCKRRDSDKVLLEGKRLIQDAIEAGFYPETFLFSRLNLLPEIPFDKSRPLKMVQVPYNNFKVWSELTTSPGTLAIFDKTLIEETVKLKPNPEALPLTVVLNDVRSPDNFGALTRVAAAAGCKRVIAIKGCVDAWNPKAIRAAAGAHFRIPINSNVSWESLCNHISDFSTVILADSNAKAVDENATGDFAQKFKELEQARQDLIVEDVEAGGKKDLSFQDEDILESYSRLHLEVRDYADMGVDQAEVILVFGGETHGLSREAIKLAHCYNGFRTKVPLQNSMESLNVVSAASIILYQLHQTMTKNSPS